MSKMQAHYSQIIEKMKASGIFDQFRKDCIADVDTKPAYINLHTRVNQSVDDYLKNVHWSSKMIRIGVRDGMRKHIIDSSYFTKGVDRIVNQAVDPKINTAFFPIVENVVYEFLGLQKPKQGETNEEFEEDPKCWEQPMDIDPPQESEDADEHESKPTCAPTVYFDEDKAKIEAELSISNDHDLIIVVDSANVEEEEADDAVDDDDEEESPPFEAIGASSPPHPFPGSVTIFAGTPPKCLKSSDTETLVTDFSSYFSKPELEKGPSTYTSPDRTESSLQITPSPDKRDKGKMCTSIVSCCNDRGKSFTKASPSDDKEKHSCSSSKEKISSSSHGYSKSKSDSSHHSKHREKEKESFIKDKNSDKDKHKIKKEANSSNHSSRASQSKYPRHSSHSTSSRRHSSDSHSKDSHKNRKSSDVKDASRSKNSHKEHKSSSSSSRRETASRSHSSSQKDYDKQKQKHNSVPSSRKSSSSRSSDHDQRSGKTKSICDDKERSESLKGRNGSKSKRKADNYEPPSEKSESYVIKQHSPDMDSTSNNTEQLSPDINEDGLKVVQGHRCPVSEKIISADQEETALDKWYNSCNENDNCDRSEGFTTIAFAKCQLDSSKFDAGKNSLKLINRTTSSSDLSVHADNELSCSLYNAPALSAEQRKREFDFSESISHDTSGQSDGRCDFGLKQQQFSMNEKSEYIRSLKKIVSNEFDARRDYFSRFMDPLFDERSVPMTQLCNQLPVSKIYVTLDDCKVNDMMLAWLRKNGARVLLQN